MSSVEVLAQWVDVTVLGEEPLVDAEFITNLRTHHHICTSEEDEPKYELVVPGLEDWVCFGRDTEEASPCEKYGLDDLDEVEEAIVGFLREVWGRAPYLDTKKFLQGSPTFVQAQLEMAKRNSSESYQRVQEAKVRSRARTGSTRVASSPFPLPPPSSQNLGTSSRPIVVSSSASSQPPPSPRSFPEPDKKKRKTLESSYSFEGEAKVDAPAFIRKHIYSYTRIGMDDVSVRNHLTILAQENIRAAAVCTKFLDIFEKTPLSSLGSTSRVEELEERLLMYQKHEKELKEEDLRKKAQESYLSLFKDLVEVRKDLLNSRTAYAELEDSIAEGAEEAWRIFQEQVGVLAPDLDLSPLDPDKIVIDGAIVSPPRPVSESELKTRGQRIIDSPLRPDDAPSSSKALETSFPTPVGAPLLGPDGVAANLPDSSGDPTTPCGDA
ncbi:uncharacterized protein DS421_7g205740 [Arachis hypogaea]|nr:uncharacterized protein DS421_7g205740 [Arachis hypogaea]